MDTQVPSSFIPKKPLTTMNPRGSAAMGTFVFLIALLVFVASLVSAGAAFAYKGFLTTSLAQKADTLQKAEAAFDPSTIQDLERLDSRINNAEALLQKHTTAYAIFDLLAQQTLANVQFTSFSFDFDTNGNPALSLVGQADGFSTIALQSDQLGASKVLKDVVFSGIVVQSNGRVSFNVKANIDPSLISYSKMLAGGTLPSLGDTPQASSTLDQLAPPSAQTPQSP